jgi:NDP-sugar pyrophosphorylase family protein
MIQVLFLAGGKNIKLFKKTGYGTRLQRDIQDNPLYQHLTNCPKALLPLSTGKPLLNYWLEILPCPLSHVYIVCNQPSYPLFQKWAESVSLPLENLLNDNTTTNDNRLGSIGDLDLAIEHFKFSCPLLIIAGDLLFFKDFKLLDFLAAFDHQHILVSRYLTNDVDMCKSGILVLDQQNKIVEFKEKPKPNETSSRWACPCFYLIPINELPRIHEFMIEKQFKLEEVDAAGKFIRWIVQKSNSCVQTYLTSGRLDIGGLDSYLEAQQYLKTHE